jgi:hypothetical protein
MVFYLAYYTFKALAMKVIIVIHYSCLVMMEEYVYTHVLDLFGCS